MHFKDFVSRYNDGSILEDAAWRAYDIEGMALDNHAYEALKLIQVPHRGSLNPAYARVAAWYDGVRSADRAKMLLGYWYVWRSIATGQRRRAALRATE